ncbi:MAG: 1-acyl-sn-glycerol-3-phosphate acyltransferase [Elusimicrobia bacterium]|nr:1-acyl-sn-glycerol-3-phosphate acyltransferase [Elusimicrobiota bacterium]
MPDRPTWVNRLAHALVALACKPFWGPVAEGLENVPASGRVIVAFNHRHWMDTLIVPLSVQRVRYPRFLGKEELFRHPGAAWLLRELGVIRLDRRRGDVSALKQALDVLEAEGCLTLFPEGTRSRTGEPGRAKPGIGFLAHKSGAPVVPGRLWNTEKFPSPATMRLKFGPPMRYGGDGSRESCQAFADKVMETIFSMQH